MLDREQADPRRSWLSFIVIAGFVLLVLFMLLDPAPSQGLSFRAKIVFWVLHIFIPLALAQSCQLALARLSLARSNVWFSVAAAGVIASALFAPIALLLDAVFGLQEVQQERFSWADLRDEWFSFSPPVTLVWLGLNAARFLRLPEELKSSSPAATKEPSSLQFMKRLPAERRGELVAVSAELHYLRVYTTLGESLILQGFGEALAEIGPENGIQIHRSHWINPKFALDLLRRDGRMQVKLRNGIVLPVARNRRAEVRAVLDFV
jgi:hypothetical protein